MKGYINVSGDYQFDNLGIVHVIIKPNAQSIHARWKGAKLQVTLPPGTSYEFVEKTLDQFRQRLENSKPKALYYIGQKLEFPEFSVEISQQSHIPDKMIMRFNPPEGLILIGNNWDMESANTMAQISKFLCRIAQRIAPDTLIPHARRVADRIGKTPLAWTISNGHRTLGHCNSKGTIALSYALVFYPLHLREYVICHELAHLTEMNHSPRFHKICDLYCNGREAELTAELKSYHIPIIK